MTDSDHRPNADQSCAGETTRVGASPDHVPIMVEPILELLTPSPGETYVDLTLGLAGHAMSIAERLGATGRIIGCDLDASNLSRAQVRLESVSTPITFLHCPFDEAPALLADQSVKADMILADLGFSSNQMDDPRRGFSFQAAGPLDMRLDPSSGLTARDLVNRSSDEELADLFRRLGEEPLAWKIAREIVEARKHQPIENTAQLVELVRKAYGSRAARSRRHPATKVFMALRIAVNDELGRLERLWQRLASIDILAPGARIAFMSFHSLEDRIVKRAMNEWVSDGRAQRLTRKPTVADVDEQRRNPRSRSAKLRAIRMIVPSTE